MVSMLETAEPALEFRLSALYDLALNDLALSPVTERLDAISTSMPFIPRIVFDLLLHSADFAVSSNDLSLRIANAL